MKGLGTQEVTLNDLMPTCISPAEKVMRVDMMPIESHGLKSAGRDHRLMDRQAIKSVV